MARKQEFTVPIIEEQLFLHKVQATTKVEATFLASEQHRLIEEGERVDSVIVHPKIKRVGQVNATIAE